MDIETEIRGALSKHPEVRVAVLFGSLGRGAAHRTRMSTWR